MNSCPIQYGYLYLGVYLRNSCSIIALFKLTGIQKICELNAMVVVSVLIKKKEPKKAKS